MSCLILWWNSNPHQTALLDTRKKMIISEFENMAELASITTSLQIVDLIVLIMTHVCCVFTCECCRCMVFTRPTFDSSLIYLDVAIVGTGIVQYWCFTFTVQYCNVLQHWRTMVLQPRMFYYSPSLVQLYRVKNLKKQM